VRAEREARLLSGIEEQARILDAALKERNRLLREAVSHRVPMAKLTAAAGLSRGHIYKIAAHKHN
jgi:AcrR family transcriptional regulator